ncbi:hypothetical protein ACWD01_24820 [Streptomyces sp. NPDC002835]|jgi:hypothetical protein
MSLTTAAERILGSPPFRDKIGFRPRYARTSWARSGGRRGAVVAVLPPGPGGVVPDAAHGSPAGSSKGRKRLLSQPRPARPPGAARPERSLPPDRQTE